MELRDLRFDDAGWVAGPFPVSGRAIRYLVLAELIRSGQAMNVAELVDKLRGQEVLLPSRPSKAVSDALRWEVRKGRIVKIRRGIYQIGYVPRSTRYWILNRSNDYRRRHLAD